ncbi:hypothetical protein ACVWZW_007946 [Bradyrhizobium sp. F1.13.4]
MRLLHETTVLIIVGYSLPPDDALLRFVIRQFAEEAEDGREKIIFYIGPGADEDKKAVIEEVFPSRGTVGVPLLQTYNSGFDQFAAECVQLISADGK